MHRTPIFVVGYPRSGTTLVRALIGAHPDARMFNEPELLRAMIAAGMRPGDALPRGDRAAFLLRLRDLDICARHLDSLGRDVVAAFLDRPDALTFSEVYESLLPAPGDVSVWGEKSLGNVFYALLVEVIRDPRAALLSYYRKIFSGSSERTPARTTRAIRFFAFRALQWSAWHEALATDMPSGANGLVVRFEDVVTDPVTAARGMCDRIGVPYAPEMLDAARRRGDPVLQGGTAFAHARLDRPIDAARASASSELPEWAAYVVEHYAGETMERCGYELRGTMPGSLARARIWLELARSAHRIRANLRRSIAVRAARSSEAASAVGN